MSFYLKKMTYLNSSKSMHLSGMNEGLCAFWAKQGHFCHSADLQCPDTAYVLLIVCTRFSMMNSRLDIGIKELALLDFGINHPVISTLHAAIYCAFEIGRGSF